MPGVKNPMCNTFPRCGYLLVSQERVILISELPLAITGGGALEADRRILTQSAF